jgi:hypothetical protein
MSNETKLLLGIAGAGAAVYLLTRPRTLASTAGYAAAAPKPPAPVPPATQSAPPTQPWYQTINWGQTIAGVGSAVGSIAGAFNGSDDDE